MFQTFQSVFPLSSSRGDFVVLFIHVHANVSPISAFTFSFSLLFFCILSHMNIELERENEEDGGLTQFQDFQNDKIFVLIKSNRFFFL